MPKLAMERLEDRITPAMCAADLAPGVYADAATGVITIQGTADHDDVGVMTTPNHQVVFVARNSGGTITFQQIVAWDPATTTAFCFCGAAGNDRFNGNDITVPVWAAGGDGGDQLQGGNGDDYLYGEAGQNTLRGFGGNDYLEGGPDIDFLYGGAGVDVLIPGAGAFNSGDYDDAAEISGIQWGDGTAQRSLVRQVVVTFNTAPTFAAGAAAAFALPGVGFTAVQAGQTVTLANFTGAGAQFGSLADGYAVLTLAAGQIAGSQGGTVTVRGDSLNRYFRLYGDSNGDATVDQVDFVAFRNAFNGGPSLVFDFDASGDVLQNDFIEFRNRFNGTL